MDSAQRRALRALASCAESDISKLALLKSALALALLPRIPALARLRRQLIGQLRHTVNTTWVKNGEASEVFAVLAALWEQNPALVTSDWLTTALQRLVSSEVAAGGPYQFNGQAAIGENASIAWFVRATTGQSLPQVDAFVSQALATKEAGASPHDLADILLLLVVADSLLLPGLAAQVAPLRHLSGWQMPLKQAVLLTILQPVLPTDTYSQCLQILCRYQLAGGLWPSGSPRDKADDAGGLFPTILITRLLHSHCSKGATTPSDEKALASRAITNAARALFATREEPLRSHALDMVNRIATADQGLEITLLPRFLGQALKQPPPVSDKTYATLGLANVCTWVAYTIYDDFLDDEGSPPYLPVANVAIRAAIQRLATTVSRSKELLDYIYETFAAMDEANAWEIAHCRFTRHDRHMQIPQLPRYGKGGILAARTFAHVLPSMIVLFRHVSPRSKQALRIESGLRHYLIARQLNDDLHDWAKDMENGQASLVVTAILRDMDIKPGSYSLTSLMPAMQRAFRSRTMPRICRQISHELTRARHQFERSGLLCVENDVYMLLDNLEGSVRASQDRYDKSQALAAMHPSGR